MAGETKSPQTSDVVVIGAGVIGCSIAFRLAQARLRVSVIDRGEPGAEASNAAAGMLAPQGETVDPDAFFDLCASSRDLYPSFLADIKGLSGCSVEYRSEGALLVATNEHECHELETIYQGQTRFGLKLERLNAEAVHKLVSGLSSEIGCGLLVPRDHWLDNERLTQALAEACLRLGVTFRLSTEVTKLNARGDRIDSVETRSPEGTGHISGGQFVLAAGCWSSALVAPLSMKLPMQPCRGQIIEFDSPADLPMVVRSGINYLVPRPKQRILVGTTAEYVGFDKAVTGAGLQAILQGAARIAPLIENLRFRRAWSGLRPDTADHRPILGCGDLKNLVLATGHFRNGILLAPVTAQLISELLLTGSTSKDISAYRPTRFA